MIYARTGLFRLSRWLQEAAGEVVVGIDLGTTNSAVAVSLHNSMRSSSFVARCKRCLAWLQTFRRKKAVSVPLDAGCKTIPSVVAYLPGEEVLVGEVARR